MTQEPRTTVVLAAADSQQLLHARGDDGVPASRRICAALTLWRDDPVLRARIDDVASREHVESVNSDDAASKPAKVSVSVPTDLNSALWAARSEDRISTSARIRAAVALWSTDRDVRGQIDAAAKQLHRSRRALRAQSEVTRTV